MTNFDRDVYETAKRAGKFRTIPRTEGVSTTDILGRMLVLSKEHHLKGGSAVGLGSQSKFLTTTRLLQLFGANLVSPREDMRIIYIDGAWDMASRSNSLCVVLVDPRSFTNQLTVVSCSTVSPRTRGPFERSKGGTARLKSFSLLIFPLRSSLTLLVLHAAQTFIFSNISEETTSSWVSMGTLVSIKSEAW